MIDVRDHGGIFGAGKYRKGAILPLNTLSIQDPLIIPIHPLVRRVIGKDDIYFYVSDAGTIYRISIDSKIRDALWSIVFAGDTDGYPPTSIIKDEASNYFVAFDNGSIIKYSSNGSKIFKTTGTSSGYFSVLYHYNNILYYIVKESSGTAVYTVNKTNGAYARIWSIGTGSSYYRFFLYEGYIYSGLFSPYQINKYNLSNGSLVYNIFNEYSDSSILDVDISTETLLFVNSFYLIKRSRGGQEIFKTKISVDGGIVGRVLYNRVLNKVYVFDIQTLVIVNATTGVIESTKNLTGFIYKNSGMIYGDYLYDGTLVGNVNTIYNSYNSSMECVNYMQEQIRIIK